MHCIRFLGDVVFELFEMKALDTIKAKAKQLKQQTITVYFAARDPRMPFLVRILAVLIAAYALSPIDLIPDFIPIIGLLDDIVIIPLGLALVIHLTPSDIMDSARLKAEKVSEKPINYRAAFFVVIIWFLLLTWLAKWALGY